MSTPFPPPPTAPEKPKRKLWPWFLGGCLVLLLIGAAVIGGIVYFGAKAMGAASTEIVASVPAVQEHFGEVHEASMDFGAMMQAGQTGASVMVFSIKGEKGEGQLRVMLDPQTQEPQSAELVLPNGETHALEAKAVEMFKGLQGGGMPQG